MISNQDMVRLLASATSDSDDSYKSMQELIRIIASCVGIDEETGEAYIKVKDAEDPYRWLSPRLLLPDEGLKVTKEDNEERFHPFLQHVSALLAQ